MPEHTWVLKLPEEPGHPPSRALSVVVRVWDNPERAGAWVAKQVALAGDDRTGRTALPAGEGTTVHEVRRPHALLGGVDVKDHIYWFTVAARSIEMRVEPRSSGRPMIDREQVLSVARHLLEVLR